jgi:hypothetical protein
MLHNRLVGFIFLIAFASLFYQSPGLYGPNGLLPVEDYLTQVLSYLSSLKSSSSFSNISSVLPFSLISLPSSLTSSLLSFLHFPSLLIFSSSIHIPPYVIFESLLLLGILSSSAISLGISHGSLFFIAWLSYLSIFLFGQVFLSFQWDILLLEVGFLAFLSSLFSPSPRHGTIYKHFNWCYRFLIWKLMFMAGVVKLQAECPTWLRLTALEVPLMILLPPPLLFPFDELFAVSLCHPVPP